MHQQLNNFRENYNKRCPHCGSNIENYNAPLNQTYIEQNKLPNKGYNQAYNQGYNHSSNQYNLYNQYDNYNQHNKPLNNSIDQTENYCVRNEVGQRNELNRINMENYYYPSSVENFQQKKKGAFIFFFADWCGHCKTFRPVWDVLKKESSNNDYEFIDINETNIPSSVLGSTKLAEKLRKLNIVGFPSLFYIYSTNDNPNEIKDIELMNRNNIISEVQNKIGGNTSLNL